MTDDQSLNEIQREQIRAIQNPQPPDDPDNGLGEEVWFDDELKRWVTIKPKQ